MEKIEVCGKTIEEAVQSGAEQLGVNVEEVDYEVLEEPQKGGLFKKPVPAKVLVSKKLTDSERAVKFLDDVFEMINIPVTTEITRDDDKICINLISTNTQFLIGYRGELLDALQCLAGAVANIGREEYKRVVVDCEGYREKREGTLNDLAEKLANKAVRTGRKIQLEPMNPFERRIIHTALAESTEVKTESEGKEPNRYIVIVPNDLRDDRPIMAGRNNHNNGNHGGNRGGYERRGDKPYGNRNNRGGFRGGKSSGGRDDRRNGGYRGGRGDRRNGGATMIYGKPKEKGNITSFGTFIGNSKKDED